MALLDTIEPFQYQKGIWAYPKKKLSRPEWLQLRRELGVGGSDVAVIAGLSEWQSPVELFYEKCGLWGNWEEKAKFNMPTYAGHVLEDVIVKHWWQYWDILKPTKEDFLENINGDRKILRKCKEPTSIFVNTKFPIIAANVDRLFKHKRKDAILEVKTGNSRLWYKYEGMLPQYYVVQVLIYMYVLNIKYAEICALLDNSHFEVFPIEWTDQTEKVVKNLIEITDDFYEKVTRVEEFKEQGHGEDAVLQFAAENEPKDTNPKAYEKFLKERYREEFKPVVVEGGEEELKMIKRYVMANEAVKAAEKPKQELKTVIIRNFVDGEFGKIEFPEMGTVSYDPKIGLRVSPRLTKEILGN